MVGSCERERVKRGDFERRLKVGTRDAWRMRCGVERPQSKKVQRAKNFQFSGHEWRCAVDFRAFENRFDFRYEFSVWLVFRRMVAGFPARIASAG
jgi:hypothetical protein